MTLAQGVTQMLSILTVFGQIAVVVVGLALLLPKNPLAQKIVHWVGKYGYQIAFLVAYIAMAGSLFYSEIAGYNPCKLCWVQRIFMYPQVLILAIGARFKDKLTTLHVLVLSGFGAVIAGYHYLLQRGVVPDLSCAAVGISESCSQRFVMSFGYITIPLMAFTGFLMIIVATAAYRRIHTSRA